MLCCIVEYLVSDSIKADKKHTPSSRFGFYPLRGTSPKLLHNNQPSLSVLEMEGERKGMKTEQKKTKLGFLCGNINIQYIATSFYHSLLHAVVDVRV